jgi:predicted RNase H-like HicB family nuclease
MEKVVLNYRVIIEPDERTGTNEPCFTAYCPTLDVVSDGDTFGEALKNIQEAIQLRVEVLVEDDEEVPVDKVDEEAVIHTKIFAPQGTKIAIP